MVGTRLAVRFETSPYLEKKAIAKAKAITEEAYNYTNKNCTSVCKAALDEAKIDHGDNNTPNGLINHLWSSNTESKPVLIEDNEE